MQRDFAAIAKRIHEEGALKVSEACKLVRAERGVRGHVSASTLVRWIITGRDGVYLDGTRGSGETWYTSEPALLRFFAALTEHHSMRADMSTAMCRLLRFFAALTEHHLAHRELALGAARPELPVSVRDRQRRAARARAELRRLSGKGQGLDGVGLP